MRVFSPSYLATLAITVLITGFGCAFARRHPGRWVTWADYGLAALLTGVTVSWLVQTATEPSWSTATSLPFALCDMATLVAAAGLATRRPILVELTYFWGLAGTIQALLTPDLSSSFPSVTFFEYVIAHGGIVCAAFFLVVGQRLAPRARAVPRVLAVTLVYTAFVGLLDAVTGGDYMFLRRPPSNWTLLSVLGPWPWYLVSAIGVALVLFTLLDAPFWPGRQAPARLASRSIGSVESPSIRRT